MLMKMKFPKFGEVTSYYVHLLRILAILPIEGRSYNFCITRFMTCYCIISSFIHSYMFTSYGYNRLKQGVIELDYVCEYVVIVGYGVRYCMVAYDRQKFLDLHNECRAIWEGCNDFERCTVHCFIKKIKTIFKWYLLMCMLVNVFYLYSAITVRLPPIRTNGTETRMLPSRFLVNGMEPTAIYAVMFVAQVIVMQLALMILLGVDTAAPFIIMFCCGYFRVLQDRLDLIREDNLFDPEQRVSVKVHKELVACTKFHQTVLKLCEKIKNFTETLFLVQVLCTGYNLSLAGIKLAGTDPDRYKFISTFGLCLVELFVCQWCPALLIEESEAVMTAAYFASLLAMNPQSGRVLMLMMERARRPVQLTAGGIINMSIESFGSIMTSAFSLFTVLRRFNS